MFATSLWLTLTECSIAPRDECCEWILCELERCRIANSRTPGNAKSIKGKLSSLLQSLCGRMGRTVTMALSLVLRCHESHGVTHFSPELKDVQFFLNIILEKGMRPSRKITLGAPARPHVLIWTDACDDNKYRGLGLVSVDTDDSSPHCTMCAVECPSWLLTTFKVQCSWVIWVLEMLAGLCGLLTLGQELRGRRVYFFCDPSASWSSMITGYASSKMMARVSAPFHLFVAALNIDLWVELVNTDANNTDLISRPRSGRGELSKTIPPLVERPMIFISKEEFNDPALFFFKKWWE